jgi:hypothetical protein
MFIRRPSPGSTVAEDEAAIKLEERTGELRLFSAMNARAAHALKNTESTERTISIIYGHFAMVSIPICQMQGVIPM